MEEANIPRVLPEEAAGILQEIAEQTFVAPGRHGAALPHAGGAALPLNQARQPGRETSASRSSPTSSTATTSSSTIPWTEDLSRIHEIVRGHHEKLNGKGYPDGVKGDELSLETKIMTVCDIFDALTASDRPYKKAMPVDKALAILRMEADEGALDPDIVELFTESRVYRKVLERDWREF